MKAPTAVVMPNGQILIEHEGQRLAFDLPTMRILYHRLGWAINILENRPLVPRRRRKR